MNQKTLNDYCEFIIDCLHNTAPIENNETGYYSIRTPDIGRGRLNIDTANRVSEKTYEKWTVRAIPQAGDLILAREAPVGNIAIVPANAKVCCGQRTVHIRPDKTKINPGYLVYLILGDEIQGKIKGQSQGATVAHLNMEDIRALVLPNLPSLPIQYKIADVLSNYDDLIENNTRRIRLLEAMAQAVYRKWFGKVDEKSLLIGWEMVKLGDVADIQWGDTSVTKASYVEDGYTAYSASGADGKLEYYDFDRTGIVLSAIGANCGKTWFTRGKWSCIKNTIRFWSISNRVSTEYLYLASADANFWTRRGAAQPFISQGDARAINIVCPSQEVMDRFTNFASVTLEEIDILHRQNANLRQTRDLLLPRLVSGEIELKL